MAIADSICWTLGNGQTASRLTSFNGQSYSYGDAGPFHAVDRIGNADRFDYDANGNMTVRNKGLSSQQTLVWDDENRLSQVQNNNGDLLEQYWYDVDGARVKKTSGTTTTYTFFAHYEEEVTGVVTTTVSHYSFGGLRIAVKRGSDLYHLHGDHLGSSSLTTRGSTVEASRAYYAYGAARAAAGNLQTDRTFTGQKSDATGLMYYNARYYDPALGAFISPDFMVPDPERVINFNRFLYARGNPLRFMDPSGHCEIGHDENGNANITRFDCTVADFQSLSWEERKVWVELIADKLKLGEWLDDIKAAIDHLSNDPDFHEMSGWAAQMDAGILQPINDGVRLRRGDEPIGGYVTYRGETYWTNGGQGWFEFFDGHDPEIHNDRNFVDHELTIIRFSAEQQGANYSRFLPETQRRLQGASLGEQVKIFLFLFGADGYRHIGMYCHQYPDCDGPYTDPRKAVDETIVGVLAELPELLTRPFRDREIFIAH